VVRASRRERLASALQTRRRTQVRTLSRC
jgi:hypothetical protein